MNVPIVLAAIALAGGGAPNSTTATTRHFVPSSRIILFGEVLDQVPSDDGKSLGTLIERTEDAVLINGRVWVSKDEKPKKLKHPDARVHRRGLVIEEAARQFRSHQKKAGEGRYLAAGQVYDETPRPFHVEKYGETVDLAVKGCATCMAYIYVTYEKSTVGMPLHPVPTPSPEERAQRQLDNVFQTAVSARPGTIIFISHGHFMAYPIKEADAFIAAMHKVPSLAVPVAEDIYGDMAYRSLTVDGYSFDPQMVAVIMRQEEGGHQ